MIDVKDVLALEDDKKYNKDNIYVINDVKEAFPIMNKLSTKKTYILLENDLPDLFNE